jgi:hypothetical protein
MCAIRSGSNGARRDVSWRLRDRSRIGSNKVHDEYFVSAVDEMVSAFFAFVAAGVRLAAISHGATGETKSPHQLRRLLDLSEREAMGDYFS